MSKDQTINRKTLEQILEGLPEGVVGHDLERRITYFNRAAEEITGWPRDELLGKDCHEVFGALSVDSVALFWKARQLVELSKITLSILLPRRESRNKF